MPSIAQQYRWVDEKGRVQYSDTPPPPSAKDVQKKNLKGSVVGTVVPFELTRAVKDAPVTLYTSPPCGVSCDKAREALNARGVPFKEVQVWDENTNAELRKISNGREVPVLVVGSRVQTGFEQGAFDRALDIGGYPKTGMVPPLKQAAPPMPEDYKPAANGTAAPPAAQK
ncbi:MAG: glutaredoxin family protein [Proteobacteria bacterium]|nr:glutaredoxin family protein [Pseudomonadota bacterium]